MKWQVSELSKTINGKEHPQKSEHKPGAGNTKWHLVAVGGWMVPPQNICPSQPQNVTYLE